VTAAARLIAKLRVQFLIRNEPLATDEIEELFQAMAIRAEWEREMYEALRPGQP
jgi:hypothetical protein